jgi:cytoskeletal protein CcmA (bactofilin family)
MNMGQSIAIKGELSGAEDLTLEGQLEGKISLPENILTVGKSARINAEVVAKAVVVLGQLIGNVSVKEKFELLAGGSMQGNVKAPRVAVADGAVFDGKVEMPGGKAVQDAAPAPKLQAVAV